MTETNYITEYWNHLDSLDEDVRKIVLDCWDETGRPITANPVAKSVGMLLDITSSYEEFLEKVRPMLHEIEISDVAIETYYYLYIQGMKRVKDYLLNPA